MLYSHNITALEQARKKSNIINNAKEAIGIRQIKINSRKNSELWFNEETKSLAQGKRYAGCLIIR